MIITYKFFVQVPDKSNHECCVLVSCKTILGNCLTDKTHHFEIKFSISALSIPSNIESGWEFWSVNPDITIWQGTAKPGATLKHRSLETGNRKSGIRKPETRIIEIENNDIYNSLQQCPVDKYGYFCFRV